jgi:hypothetical protein
MNGSRLSQFVGEAGLLDPRSMHSILGLIPAQYFADGCEAATAIECKAGLDS